MVVYPGVIRVSDGEVLRDVSADGKSAEADTNRPR